MGRCARLAAPVAPEPWIVLDTAALPATTAMTAPAAATGGTQPGQRRPGLAGLARRGPSITRSHKSPGGCALLSLCSSRCQRSGTAGLLLAQQLAKPAPAPEQVYLDRRNRRSHMLCHVPDGQVSLVMQDDRSALRWTELAQG